MLKRFITITPEACAPRPARRQKAYCPSLDPTAWKGLLQALVIAAAVAWIYWPSLNGDWLRDDTILVTQNSIVQDPDGLRKIWFEPAHLIDYQPIEVSVVWLEWYLEGNDTLGYHLANVILHTIGALLVWRLLARLGLRLAWLGGLLFAVHPMQVESVAWISELKNTLSLPPFLLAMLFWIDFDEHKRGRDYALALGLFVVAMLCKSSMATFPLVILLYAWWKRGRIGWSDVKAGVPFFLVSLALGMTTVWFLHHHAIARIDVPWGGWLSRMALVGLSSSFYFSKSILPVGLLPIYPQWPVEHPLLWQFVPWLALAGAMFLLWKKREGWGRHAFLGLGFFGLMLAPFVGFTAASYMNVTWVADHLVYLPIIGLIGLAVAALERADAAIPQSLRTTALALVAGVVVLLATSSRDYAGAYVNFETLCAYTVRGNPDSALAHNNLANALADEGRVSESIDQFRQVTRIEPGYKEAHFNLANELVQVGQTGEAITEYEQALRIDPDDANTHYNLGNSLFQAGRVPEAIGEYRQVERITPAFAPAYCNLGSALLRTGRAPEAIDQYKLALSKNPGYAEAHNDLGSALIQTGRLAEANVQFEDALRINPNYADAEGNWMRSQALLKNASEKN